MKATRENLLKVLDISAKAHNTSIALQNECGVVYVAIYKENVPLTSDLRMITQAFFKTTDKVECCGYGVTIFNLENEDYRDEVDTKTLQFALPFGALKDFE